MSREDIVAIAVRLFSIVLAMSGLRMFAGGLAVMRDGGDLPGMGLYAAFTLGVFAAAVLLWYFPLTVARKLLPVMKEPRSESSAAPSLMFSLALTLMGIWLLAGALLDAVYWGVLFARVQAIGAEYHRMSPDQWADVLATGVQLVVALVLILGADGLRNLLFRLRYGSAADRIRAGTSAGP